MKKFLLAAGAVLALGCIDVSPAAAQGASVYIGRDGPSVGVQIGPQGGYRDGYRDGPPRRIQRERRCERVAIVDRWGNVRGYERQCY